MMVLGGQWISIHFQPLFTKLPASARKGQRAKGRVNMNIYLSVHRLLIYTAEHLSTNVR